MALEQYHRCREIMREELTELYQAMLKGAARNQLEILQAAGLQPTDPSRVSEVLRRAQVSVDALIGYGLRGAPQGWRRCLGQTA